MTCKLNCKSEDFGGWNWCTWKYMLKFWKAREYLIDARWCFFKSLWKEKNKKKKDSHEVMQDSRQASSETVLNSERLIMATLVQRGTGQFFCYYVSFKPKNRNNQVLKLKKTVSYLQCCSCTMTQFSLSIINLGKEADDMIACWWCTLPYKLRRRMPPYTLAVLSDLGLCCGCDSAPKFFLLITHWGLRWKMRAKGMWFRGSVACHLLGLVYATPQHELLLLAAIMQFLISC